MPTQLERAVVTAQVKQASCCGSFLVSIVVILCLALHPGEPKCYIGAFYYVPRLNKTLNATTNNPTIVFMVEFDNGNDALGIRYENVNITVDVFLDRNRTSPIGSSIIPGFYQGLNKNAKKWGSIETHDDGTLDLTAKVDRKTYFRVNFTTSLKYKMPPFYTKRYRLWGGANVAVNASGSKDEKAHIRLGHSLPVIVPGAARPLAAGFCRMLLVLGLLLSALYS